MDDKERIIKEAEEQAKLINDKVQPVNNNNKSNNTLIIAVIGLVVVALVLFAVILLNGNNKKDNSENKDNTNVENKEVTNTENKEITNTEVTNTEVTNTEIEPDQPKEIVGTEITDPNIIAELDKYFDVIKNYDKMPEELHNGLDEANKIEFTLSYMFNNNMYTMITRDNLPEKYIGDSYFEDTFSYGKPSCLLEVKFNDFENVSEKLFGEVVNTELKNKYNTPLSANIPKAIIDGDDTYPCIGKELDDEEIMYLNICACGNGLNVFTITYDKVKYTEDENYYYMYIKGNTRHGATDETTTDDIVVKFDKDYKFIEMK